MNTICFVIIDRANYGRLEPLIDAVQDHPKVLFNIIAGGSIVLDRFNGPELAVAERVYCEIEGGTPDTMTKSIGLAIHEFVSAYDLVNPDYIVIIGDRYEALGAAIAAKYTGRELIHLQGGEISGTLDNTTRNLITEMADYHVPATQNAKWRILDKGAMESSILEVGCPSVDIASRIEYEDEGTSETHDGLCICHPDTLANDGDKVFEAVWEGTQGLFENPLWMWPNIDPGASTIMAKLREHKPGVTIRTNMPPLEYYDYLSSVRCCVGNSSSFARDAGFFGTPVVLVGDRQQGREVSDNVLRCAPSANAVYDLVKYQLEYGRYNRSWIYGTPGVSGRIADKLADL